MAKGRSASSRMRDISIHEIVTFCSFCMAEQEGGPRTSCVQNSGYLLPGNPLGNSRLDLTSNQTQTSHPNTLYFTLLYKYFVGWAGPEILQ